MGGKQSKQTASTSHPALHEAIHAVPVLVYGKSYSSAYQRALTCFTKMRVSCTPVETDQLPNEAELVAGLKALTGSKKFPYVFISGEFVGGDQELFAGLRNGSVQRKLKKAGVTFQDVAEEREFM
jgi:glutaredoxin-related protein